MVGVVVVVMMVKIIMLMVAVVMKMMMEMVMMMMMEMVVVSVRDLTSEDLAKMIEKVHAIYKAHVDHIESTLFQHPCVQDEICSSGEEDICTILKDQAALRKELMQQAGLIGQMAREKFLDNQNSCFVELGAGKGKLSHWIRKASGKNSKSKYLLVERSSVRYKVDGHQKQDGDVNFKRIKMDIEDLYLGKVPELQNVNKIFVVGKHLCGGATDMGIRCAVNTLTSHKEQPCFEDCLENQSLPAEQKQELMTDCVLPTDHERDRLSAKIGSFIEPPVKIQRVEETTCKEMSRLPKGIMIALCCHHQCTWDTYVGKSFMKDCGIGPKEFDLLTRLSSWATCARVRDDDLFQLLRGCFLHSGKGRPRQLPSDIPVTNKLLVQLWFLKEKDKKPWTVIDDWLAKIDSRVTLMERSASHFCNLVNSTIRRFEEMEESELGEFLALPVDLDTISPELSTLGVTKSTFSKPPPVISTGIITNQAVVDFEAYRVQQGLPKTRAVDWLHNFYPAVKGSAIQCAVSSALKAYNGLSKNKRKNPDSLCSFLKAEFAKKFKSNDTPYTAAARQASTATLSSSAAPVQPLSSAPSLAPIQPLPSAPQAQPTAVKQPLPSVQQQQKTVDHPSRPPLAVIVSRKSNKCTQCSESQEQILALKDIIHELKTEKEH
ncbi:tRNA:m(4)x modification enzyme trm13 [Plakobranchus ocellatus]|uniref:tRNA:m(4)X modification enzyme TRM13 n=1 Tax=Plakobranchus ocellatus TaxID=259542 RepID=A0AAV3YFD9_9GAST|nr:tRNA:m(4)x modification enzyme trm13 [Plakobranchus ocellatus]